MFKQSIFAAIAILSIAASATADAKPRHNKQRAVHATIACDDRGCLDHRSSDRGNSDRGLTVRDTAYKAVKTKFRAAHRNRVAGIKRAAVVRYAPRTEVRQVRASRERTDTGVIVCNQQGCSDRVMPIQTTETATAARAGAPRASRAARYSDANGNAIIVGGRPAGCPHRFCGCEASRYVFGEIRPELNLAYNWIRKFPRTSPSPGMAAARSGHVMVLISHAGGNDWLVHDGNSGGGLTRDHVMSINRYVIVDPRGARTAQR